MKHYLARPKGSFYPFDVYADSLARTRQKARETGLKIAEVWEFTQTSERLVKENWRKMANDYARAGQIHDP